MMCSFVDQAHGDINRAVDAFLNNEGVPISYETFEPFTHNSRLLNCQSRRLLCNIAPISSLTQALAIVAGEEAPFHNLIMP